MTAPDNDLKARSPAVRTVLGLTGALTAVSIIYLLIGKTGIPVLTPILEAVYGYGIAIAFMLAQIGLGSRLLRFPFFHGLGLRGLPFILFSFVIGFHLSYTLLLLLALLPVPTPSAFLLYLTAGIPAAGFGILSLVRMLKKRAEDGRRLNSKKRILVRTAVGLLILWSLPYLVQSILPNSDWDGDAYHLPQAKRYLEGRVDEVHLTYPAYSHPGAVHLVYAFFLAAAAESAVIPFHLLVSLMLVLAVYSMAARFWSGRAGFWAAAIWAGCNLLWEVALTPRIDGFLAFFCFMAGYATFLAVHDRKGGSALLLCGFALGTASGIKYTALFVPPVCAAALILASLTAFRLRFRRMIFPAPLASAVLLLPSGFWYGRNLLQTGNPVYHFVTGIIFENSSGERVSITDILPELTANGPSRTERDQTFRQHKLDALAADISYREDPHNLFNFWRIFRKPEHYQRKPYHEINLLLLLFFILPLVSRSRDSLLLFGMGLSLYLIIGAQTYLLRYALPALPFMALGAGIAMSRLRFRMLRTVLTVVLILSGLRFTVLQYSKLAGLQPLGWFSGTGDPLTWLIRVGYNRKTSVPLFVRYVNTQIDQGIMNATARIYMVGEAKGAHLNCRYEPDTSRWATPWLIELYKAGGSYAVTAENLQARGFGWVAYNRDYFRVVVENQSPQREPLLLAVFHLLRFVDQEAVIVYENEDIVLARLKNAREQETTPTPTTIEPLMACLNRICIRNSL